MLTTDIFAHPVDYARIADDSTVLDKIEILSGGDAMNVALVLSKLGCGAGFCGMVGDDMFGRYVKDVLRAHGVDARGLKTALNAATSAVIVLVDRNGQRVFLYSAGANDLFSYGDIDESLIAEARHVHIGGTFAMPGMDEGGSLKLLMKAKDLGKNTSMDVTWDPSGRWLKTVEPCFPYLDLFMPSELEAVKITGLSEPERIGEFLLEKKVGTAVIKLGERGSYTASGTECFYQDAFEVAAIDTTGAGDCFVGGYLSRYSDGASPRECARFATAVSAHCVGSIGATAGVPDRETVERFLSMKRLR